MKLPVILQGCLLSNSRCLRTLNSTYCSSTLEFKKLGWNLFQLKGTAINTSSCCIVVSMFKENNNLISLPKLNFTFFLFGLIELYKNNL